ncbi:MAG: NAD(P)-binding domain-containing protein [Sandaracinaceae bacterium]|nr:NAD(P)-binding domain-containing protein [Sandaracinaceae bacterium]
MLSYFLITALAFGLAALAVALWRRVELKRERRASAALEDLEGMGPVVAAGRHPKIDPYRCIGSGACVAACPEKGVLAIVDGRGALVNPLACVGHGLCQDACPVEAISLVYGSREITLRLPKIDEHLETNVAGLFVCGEASGMGLIKNAVRQGRTAAEHIAAGNRRGKDGAVDVVVVGAGPSGISATLALMDAGLNVQLLDQNELGGTIRHYPRAKVVMTGTLELPLYGKVRGSTMSKEELVALWEDIDQRFHLPLRAGELVEDVARRDDGTFVVRSTSGETRAASVVLALGRRGTPRKLEIPGEEHPKVAYQLLEPAEFAGKRALVVGGGNSAVECAIALAEAGGCESVAISYRRGEFARCRGDNRARIAELIERGAVRALLKTELTSIEPTEVSLKHEDGREERIANDAVIVQVGGTPPSALLTKWGVALVAKRGEE